MEIGVWSGLDRELPHKHNFYPPLQVVFGTGPLSVSWVPLGPGRLLSLLKGNLDRLRTHEPL